MIRRDYHLFDRLPTFVLKPHQRVPVCLSIPEVDALNQIRAAKGFSRKPIARGNPKASERKREEASRAFEERLEERRERGRRRAAMGQGAVQVMTNIGGMAAVEMDASSTYANNTYANNTYTHNGHKKEIVFRPEADVVRVVLRPGQRAEIVFSERPNIIYDVVRPEEEIVVHEEPEAVHDVVNTSEEIRSGSPGDMMAVNQRASLWETQMEQRMNGHLG